MCSTWPSEERVKRRSRQRQQRDGRGASVGQGSKRGRPWWHKIHFLLACSPHTCVWPGRSVQAGLPRSEPPMQLPARSRNRILLLLGYFFRFFIYPRRNIIYCTRRETRISIYCPSLFHLYAVKTLTYLNSYMEIKALLKQGHLVSSWSAAEL